MTNITSRSKYNVSSDVSRRTYNGIIFDSELEMKFYRDYVIPKIKSGEILNCERQIKFVLQEKFEKDNKTVLPVTYVADFVLTDSKNHTLVIDTKGMPDSVALLKRKLFWYKYPDIDYQWIGYSKIDGGWVPYEVIKQCRKERKKQKEKNK